MYAIRSYYEDEAIEKGNIDKAVNAAFLISSDEINNGQIYPKVIARRADQIFRNGMSNALGLVG